MYQKHLVKVQMKLNYPGGRVKDFRITSLSLLHLGNQSEGLASRNDPDGEPNHYFSDKLR